MTGVQNITIPAGANNVRINVRAWGVSTGYPIVWPKTGMALANVDLMGYWRDGGLVVTDDAVALGGVGAAHTDWGFVEYGNGVYRFDFPDAAFAAGARWVVLMLGSDVTSGKFQSVLVKLEADVQLARKLVANSREFDSGEQKLTIFDDDGVTPLKEFEYSEPSTGVILESEV